MRKPIIFNREPHSNKSSTKMMIEIIHIFQFFFFFSMKMSLCYTVNIMHLKRGGKKKFWYKKLIIIQNYSIHDYCCGYIHTFFTDFIHIFSTMQFFFNFLKWTNNQQKEIGITNDFLELQKKFLPRYIISGIILRSSMKCTYFYMIFWSDFFSRFCLYFLLINRDVIYHYRQLNLKNNR